MKILLVFFVLLSFVSSQTPPINDTTYEIDSLHTDFRKCVWKRCLRHYKNCSCGYILSDEILKFGEEKLGTCISRHSLCDTATRCAYNVHNPICGYYFNREIPPRSYLREILLYYIGIIGFFIIAGNAYVIARSFVKTSCFKQAWPSASLHCNHIIILNIAVADFIMGLCLMTFSITNRVIHSNTKLTLSLGCSILGSLLAISSEASCFLMVTLTSFRLFHVYWPLSSMTASGWPWKVCIFMCWFVAMFVGVYPIVGTLDYCGEDYVMENGLGDTLVVPKTVLEDFVFTVVSLDRSNYNNYSLEPELEYVKRYFPQYASQYEFKHSLTTYFSVQDFKIQRDIMKLVVDIYLSFTLKGNSGFYGGSILCLPSVAKAFHSYSLCEYTVGFMALNLTCFIFIAVGYILIYMHSTKKRPINASSTANLQKREAKLQKRIARIIITNFVCWVPVFIMTFVQNSEWNGFNDIIDEICAVVLFPINSLLNPFLYSVSLSNFIKKLGCRPTKRCRN